VTSPKGVVFSSQLLLAVGRSLAAAVITKIGLSTLLHLAIITFIASSDDDRLILPHKVVIMFSLFISKTFHIPSKVYHKYILYYMAPIYRFILYRDLAC
jgi:hypothetical protein